MGIKNFLNSITTVDLGHTTPKPINPEVKSKESPKDMCSYCHEGFSGDKVAQRRALHISTKHPGRPA